jgi:hypothetical protein
MDTIATIGILGTWIVLLHLRLERRFDRFEAHIDRLIGEINGRIEVAGGGPSSAA